MSKQPLSADVAPAPLQVETLTGGVEIIERLATPWRALCATGRCRAPFFQPEWIAAYVRAFAADKRLVICTVRRAGQLRAVLPLIAETAPLHGIPVRKLRSASGVHSCRFDLIANDEDVTAVSAAIWQALRQRAGWDVLELFDVPQNGGGEQLLSAAANEGFLTGRWEMPSAPYLTFAASSGTSEERWAASQRGVSAKFRSSLRRLRRKLEAQGDLQLTCESQALPSELSSFYALERRGWKGQLGTAIACHQPVQMFYDTIAQTMSEAGRFLLYRLACGTQTIAMQFCVTDGQTCYVLKPTYDERFSQYSPGQLLVSDLLQDLLRRGFSAYDMLSPVAEWKNRWAHTVCQQSHLYIFRRGFIGHALHAWKFQVALRARHMKQNYQVGSTQGVVL